ncbi:protein disulfide-isomerase A5-like [Ornithodoros turicata]|uniref:protein disulfide-isomerase A5-like n=1 Tax=Ornithodoros turicata TaxID=34597 RepID=UPI003138D6A8
MARYLGLGVRGSIIFLLAAIACCIYAEAKKTTGRELMEDITDIKDFKKLLRTKKNVLVLFTKTARDGSELLRICADVALEMKGQATLGYIDCGGDGKKLCKKLKAVPDPTVFKHYKDGEFHKDYDRKVALQSMVNFLRDPTGDIPWEEDEQGVDVYHVPDAEGLGKLLQREKNPVMVMFYAPWCGFCKRMKPDYSAAATELKGQFVLAAMDVNKPENAVVRRHFNITGFPTLLYFENGNLKHKYDGANTKDSLIEFMKNPGRQTGKPKEDEAWADTSSDVVHLTDSTFTSFLEKEPSVLVMFYAPWCGHCKKMKPEYVEAAAKLKADNIPGVLAAVDATTEKTVAEKFKITGYPTVKYFKNGQLAFDANQRTAAKIVEFMKDPKEPPPPPPPEVPWSQVPSDVVHLDENNFKTFLKRKKHVLVMFYAPWCGHCKRAKPEFQAAAAQFKDDPKVEYAAVDCTENQGVCSAHDVSGYPTFKYFSYFKTAIKYDGGRKEADFVNFMKEPIAGAAESATSTEKPKEEWWEGPGADHVHRLTKDNFDSVLKEKSSVLVMFYAPWCGHCKNMKAAYAEAAAAMDSQKIPGALAAVDATVERDLASKYNVRGFPTLKYFKNGNLVEEYNKQRTADDLVNYMKNPPSTKKTEL